MTFEECEMAILREAIQEGDRESNNKLLVNPDVQQMISIVETFIADKKLVCYGGTAINNILPKEDQFYDLTKEVPDYDFYSKSALDDAKELADIFYEQGYTNVEAKSGVHFGTYKVFVNFIPIADITQMPDPVFDAISKEAIIIKKIRYCPPNFLRMAMYLELSRPKGDTSRWEKVLTRLNLLNKHYPILTSNDTCNSATVLDSERNSIRHDEYVHSIVRDMLMEEGAVFFGGYAASVYLRYMPSSFLKLTLNKTPEFDVLATNPESLAKNIAKELSANGFDDIVLVRHRHVGEILPEHIEIRFRDKSIAFIYKPLSCHSYNTVNIYTDDNRDARGKPINVATIDTLLSFYFAFIYSGKDYYRRDRILCVAELLFSVMRKNRLAQKGLLKRFTMKCYGKSENLDSIRNKKTRMFNLLKHKRDTLEYEQWFLKYDPAAVANKKGLERIVKTRRSKHTTTLSTPKLSKTQIIHDFDQEPELSETDSTQNRAGKDMHISSKKKSNKEKSSAVKWLDFLLFK